MFVTRFLIFSRINIWNVIVLGRLSACLVDQYRTQWQEFLFSSHKSETKTKLSENCSFIIPKFCQKNSYAANFIYILNCPMKQFETIDWWWWSFYFIPRKGRIIITETIRVMKLFESSTLCSIWMVHIYWNF